MFFPGDVQNRHIDPKGCLVRGALQTEFKSVHGCFIPVPERWPPRLLD